MPIRLTYVVGFMIIVLLLSASVYLQMFDGFAPCPLCTLQRLTFLLLGFWFLFGIFLHAKRWGRIFINVLSILTAIIGIMLAGRQIWLQHTIPTNSNECIASLQYMLEVLPLNQVIQKVLLEGGAECTKRGWEFLHLNMAEWALIWFSVLLLMIISIVLKEFKRTQRRF